MITDDMINEIDKEAIMDSIVQEVCEKEGIEVRKVRLQAKKEIKELRKEAKKAKWQACKEIYKEKYNTIVKFDPIVGYEKKTGRPLLKSQLTPEQMALKEKKFIGS